MCLAHFLFHGNNGPILLLSSVPFLKKIRGVRVPHQNKLQMGVGQKRSVFTPLLVSDPSSALCSSCHGDDDNVGRAGGPAGLAAA